MKATFYGFLQLLLWLCAVPFNLLGQLLMEIHPRTIERRIMTGPYYWAVVRKRRANGEPEWQEHDMHALGIPPPKDHPYWQKQPPELAGFPGFAGDPVRAELEPLPKGTIVGDEEDSE